MRNGDTALLLWMLELNVAALLGHLNPTIPLKSREYFSAIHGVYLYTLKVKCQRSRKMSTIDTLFESRPNARRNFDPGNPMTKEGVTTPYAGEASGLPFSTMYVLTTWLFLSPFLPPACGVFGGITTPMPGFNAIVGCPSIGRSKPPSSR